MEFVWVAIAALFGSGLTLFSGFGLGTILLPVFILAFPGQLEIAIAMTAIVHLLNNIFKSLLLRKHFHWKALLYFGVPACLAAIGGALLLEQLGKGEAIATWEFGSKTASIMPIDLTIGILITFFALFELIPQMRRIQVGSKYWIPGGLLSGFFGGLSGHQGALRTVFLVRSGLSKEQFIGTGIAIALLVDIGRLSIYTNKFTGGNALQEWPLLLTAIISAFTGAVIGKLLMKKATWQAVHLTVGILLLLTGIGLSTGIIAAIRSV